MSVRSGYEQTEIGEIPEEWGIVSLADISHKIVDIDHKMPQKTREGVPFISIKYLLKNVNTIFELDKQDEDLEFISESDYAYYSRRFDAEYEDILYSRFGTIGNAKLIYAKEKIIASYSIALIKPNREIISPLFLAYLLNSAGAKRQAKSKTKGSTNQNLHLSEIKTIMLPLPPLSEQRKITSTLSTVDASIQKSDQIITRTRQLKTALMQQLFIRGIGHTHFTETKIGKLPEEWDVTELGNIAEITMGQSPAGDTYNATGMGKPLINGPAEFGDLYPTPVQWTTTPTKMCEVSDILFCVRGNTAGRMNRADQEYCVGRGISAIRGCPQQATTDFIYYLLEHQRPIIYRIGAGAGSTFPNIGFHDLSTYSVALPPISEQQVIASIFSTLDEKIEKDKQKRKQLEHLKKGLMNDLLTGKVRVKVT